MKLGFWSLCALMFNSCGGVEIKDIEVCTIERQIDAGATCATSNSQRLRSVGIDELIAFLEPNDERPGALCISTSDWVSLKISLEQLCKQARCSKEVRQFVEGVLSGKVPRASD